MVLQMTEKAKQGITNTGQPKILIVDDRDDNLLSFRSILEPDNYEIITAQSGSEALKILLHQFDFALILMDVEMPNLDGFETASMIFQRDKLKNIPIVFITANSYGDEKLFKGYKIGAVDYIYKPVNPDLLRMKVAVFVELYNKTLQLKQHQEKLMITNRTLEAEINDRKASEEKVKALNVRLLENIERLETANDDLERFAFIASHDLQEPLRKILTFSDRIVAKYHDKLDETGTDYMSRIQKAASRMQSLIRDILSLSQIALNKNSFSMCDLNVLLQDVMTEIDEKIREKGGVVQIESLPTMNISPQLIRSVFHNLLMNCVKYGPSEKPLEIKIHSEIYSAKQIEQGKSHKKKYCRIYISDNGIGFDQKYSEKVFKMFTRLNPANNVEGTGIGLALCKKIVEMHNGTITARSKEMEGSTFIVSLPVVEENKVVKSAGLN
jgi:signal transduction histidine kinase